MPSITRHARLLAVMALAVLTLPTMAHAAGQRVLFIHHSTGRNLIQEGDVRLHMDQANATKSLDLVLWDHDYNSIGLSDTAGDRLGYSFEIPNDNTDPAGLHTLWTTANAARDSILARFDIIAFKSCYYPTMSIGSDEELEQYKTWYREIRDVLDQHPSKIFVIMTPPPLLDLLTDDDDAARARAYATWLGSDEFLAGHANLRFFDLYTLMAHPDDGSVHANRLRQEYERGGTVIDSHPNELANQTVGPVFVDFLAWLVATPSAVHDTPTPLRLMGNYPNPFNPSTTIRFSVDTAQPALVQVFDLRGRFVATLLDRTVAAGDQGVPWDGRDHQGRAVGSGVYLYRVRAGAAEDRGRMVLTK